MLLRKFFLASLIFSLFFLFACSKDDDNGGAAKGNLKLEITDAPADDAEIEAVFVTVAEIEIDGEEVEGFNKTTIDLMLYQEGLTYLLADIALDARQYNRVSLVLDNESDAAGNSPGSYVLTTDGLKHALATSSQKIHLDHNFGIVQHAETHLVIDFDLRKTIKRSETGESKYAFVSSAQMNNSIRVVNASNAGTIVGNCNDMITDSDLIIVYAYHKGSFNKNVETQASSETNLLFSNAVNSATVDANGNYQLHFLEEGEYQLHFASYKRDDQTGRLELNGSLELDLLTSGNLKAVQVDANANTTVNVLVTGLLPL